ncbi:MAG: NAD-dependent deacylase [Anaerolineales bacterium]|nr:NAD-dependent deacylase [Anaerolineales bacterium]
MSDLPPDLLARLRAARQVTALTGAGVSAESGVPTFRDAQTGLWAQYQPEDLATTSAFRRDPELVWNWYAWRRDLVRRAEPNPGHRALAQLEKALPGFTLITQNVDGLHQRAGSRTVIELHGSLERVKCFDCGAPAPAWPEAGPVPPRCGRCGGRLRPDVVWFGEALPPAALSAAWAAAQHCQVFLCIGTSGLVEPAASLPGEARRHGAALVEINPQPTPLSALADFVLRAPAGAALPKLTAFLAE